MVKVSRPLEVDEVVGVVVSLEEDIDAVLPDASDIVKAALCNVTGAISHLRDAVKTEKALAR